MALKVWLPLNDSLYVNNTEIRQLGVSGSKAIPSSTGIDRQWYGKTGPCRSFTSGGYIGLDAANVNNHKYSPITLSAWVYFPVTDSTERYIIDCFESGGCGLTGQNQQVSFVFYTSSYKYCRSQTISLNTWHHVCATYDNATASMYIDGILQSTLAAAGPITYHSTCPGEIGGNPGATSWGSGNLTASLNDIRIYNHCLNIKEINEISQGLILHYKFHGLAGGVGENLVQNSNGKNSTTTPPTCGVNWGSPPTREIVTINGKKGLHVISNTTQFQGYSQNGNQRSADSLDNLLPNTQYTISFTAYASEASTLAPVGIHWCNSSGTIVSQNWATTNLTTQPTRYNYTYTTPADCTEFNIMVGDSTAIAHEVGITDIKLEKGVNATPGVPSTNEGGPDDGGDQGIEANCAPIGMNLRTFVGKSYIPDATAYNGYSLSLDENQYMDTDRNPVSLEALTVAWRGYSNNWSDLANLTSLVRVANSTFSIRNNKLVWSIDENDAGIRTVASTTNVSSLNGAGHHFAGIYDGTTVCLYIDGILNVSQTFSPKITGTNVGIGVKVDEDNAPILQ